MPISKDQQNKVIKIETDKLIPFLGYAFNLFEKGKQFEDLVDDVRRRGIISPIIVRHFENDRYEILDGHYRVAVAKKIKLTMVPAILKDVSDDEALCYVSDINPIGLWEKYGIDIYDRDYKKSGAYKKLENARVFYENDFSMALDEYIERILLTEEERKEYFESIYDLGNSYKLNECECEYHAIAREIVRVMGQTGDLEIQNEMEQFKKPSRYIGDQAAAKVADEAYKQEKDDLVNNTLRQIKDYGRQFKKYLNIDMASFDYNMIQNRQERAKILYFFYILRNRELKGFNVLQYLSKPSMENVDNSFCGWETSNGKYIKFIKHAVEKEITINLKTEIIAAVRHIVDAWGNSITEMRLEMEGRPDQDDNYAIKMKKLESAMSREFIYEEDLEKSKIMSLSPLGLFYLKLVQYEYLGQMKDLLMLFELQTNVEYNVPERYIGKMKKYETKNINIEDLDVYFQNNNVRQIAELVYLKQEISKEERKRIVQSKEKVQIFLEFCLLYNINLEKDFTELLIISCLQDIILSKKGEKFNYKFFGYEGEKGGRKNIKSVQTALVNDEHTYDALQIYWIHRVVNRSYANVGRSVFRKNFRELERLQCNILVKILSCSTMEEMLRVDTTYKRRMIESWHLF